MNEELVTIATYPTPAEAEVARVALEAEGITAFVTNDNLVGMTWILGNAVGYVKLLVAAPSAERATRILEAHFDNWSQVDAEPWNCPRCGEDVDAQFDECWSCGAARPVAGATPPQRTLEAAPTAVLDAALPPPGAENKARAENPYASPLANDTADKDEHTPAVVYSGDELSYRAWRASVFGLVICPPFLSFYSAWLLLKLAFSNQPLSDRGQRRMYGAWALNLLTALGFGLFLVILSMLSRDVPR